MKTLSIHFFVLLLPAFLYAQPKITPAEARTFVKDFLEIYQYDQSPDREARLAASFLDEEARRDGETLFYDPNAQLMDLPEHDVLEYFRNGLLGIERGGKRGVLHLDGRVVIPLKYEAVSRLDDSLFAVQRDGKWGISDLQGQEIRPPQYDEIQSSRSLLSAEAKGPFIFTQNEKKGLLDRQGKVICPAAYDYISGYDAENGLLQVMIGEKYGLLDVSGQLAACRRNT